ncbi:hypothetical protein BC939DRAFT_436320 [Gamsiella multidivaricata]|uniref:uncharacterized protein n=1 Tax=Gamsiella multidivaricata TaxID=101098 RepID=UPI00222054A8|nr:uncharacterized protein BC939DRAFT_436320 [Gamsiella multidivaricata]KAG0369650.1 hypothetical protein BGZ54_009299 [Gamsiella multidivaricata]KAI7831728.1 hypothetical protein BC939DRAFT_436320 [Gamsiella multidivaricata]
MKFLNTIALIALGAIAISSTAEAAISAGCNTYLTNLAQPSNPLSNCRVYTALGFPNLTHTADHDTVKLEKALTTYCATPACTSEQYAGVYKDLQANCAADMVAENQPTLGATMYMWYLSPAQRQAVCLQNPTKNTTCVIDSINEMIARAQFPNDNKNEDDLYGYLQYVTPMLSAKSTNETGFCTACNQEVANIFSNYYTKTPSPFNLNFAQQLSSKTLNDDLQYQYKTSCKVTLGTDQSAFKPTNVTTPSAGSKDGKDTKDGKDSAAVNVGFSLAGVAAAAIAVAGALAL